MEMTCQKIAWGHNELHLRFKMEDWQKGEANEIDLARLKK